MLKILKATQKNIIASSEQLKNGGLVAFPTETVYGLGASAYHPEAIEAVFKVKGRPYSDPLILHVASVSQALELYDISQEEKRVFAILSEAFWPGPLTIVARAQANVSKKVTSDTGFVGVRIPHHSVAQTLLGLCNIPIAAPSANVFGHVSPSSAQHVFNDFKHIQSPDIFILDGGPCDVGIESTVVFLDDGHLRIMRQGKIYLDSINKILSDQGIKIKVSVNKSIVHSQVDLQVSPGQLLHHYAPHIPAYLVTDVEDVSLILKHNSNQTLQTNRAVVLDFYQQFKKFQNSFLGYEDLSSEGNTQQAATNLYAALRRAEQYQNATAIILPRFELSKDPLAQALHDRIYRSCSGRRCIFKEDAVPTFVLFH